ncbi:MAG: tRNA lysidine(34) synthetase TilS [Actinomycetota bacterium]
MPRRPPAVARTLQKVTATIRDHEMILPGETVLVAVSGGPDSTCLLHSLYRLRRLLRIKLQVFHFDHRLRRGSEDDAEYVKKLAARLDLPFHMLVAESKPAKGESVEDWAHRARMRALAVTQHDVGASHAAIGHTLDDQAETVLLALIRGGGLDAVAGIRPTQGPYVRPLIDTTREEVEAFCRALHLRPRTDPTNRDTRILRNAVRLRVLPALERAVGRDVKATIARTAAVLRDDATELELQAARALDELLEEDPDGYLLPAAPLAALPRAIASRVALRALYRTGVVPSAEHVEAVLDLAAGRPGRKRSLPGGLIASRDREYVRLSRTSPGIR